MNSLLKVFVVFIMVFHVQRLVIARPNRIKRVSDSHLADLETRLALSRMKQVAITLPITAGLRNPAEIGRRRRSESRFLDVLFNQSEEDNDSINPDYDYKFDVLKFQ
ncbi:uncharacterized protein LOC109597837 [Aethina tumida]|uniref:uncharacterized protein LOC109597837 n=1 Tax=Aethina tumida TaxID=116153 RepID=UPI00096B32C7|nr:uncharacterized protein LOC109597837 [Aethina tumida]